jgi:hypothetical protein
MDAGFGDTHRCQSTLSGRNGQELWMRFLRRHQLRLVTSSALSWQAWSGRVGRGSTGRQSRPASRSTGTPRPARTCDTTCCRPRIFALRGSRPRSSGRRRRPRSARRPARLGRLAWIAELSAGTRSSRSAGARDARTGSDTPGRSSRYRRARGSRCCLLSSGGLAVGAGVAAFGAPAPKYIYIYLHLLCCRSPAACECSALSTGTERAQVDA